MENTTVACVQQRVAIMATREEFETQARRFLHQARAKAARIVIFPELTGVMLAPPLISRTKLGFIRRADHGNKPTAGVVSRRLGRVSGAAAGAMGGGFRGSLSRLLKKDSDSLREAYFDTFGSLAREYGAAILAGSLYLYDAEAEVLRNRAYLFDVDGEVLGYQDKLNLAPGEEGLATPGTEMSVLETRFGRLGVLLGRDVLYPELARTLAMQGAELLIGIVASPGAAQSAVIRAAMALRAEENQVFTASSFLVGPNYLDQSKREDLFGQSALWAPISMTKRGDGVLVQTGTNRTEGLIAAELDAEALHDLWETSGFRPRRDIHLGNAGPALAEVYQQGLTIEDVAPRDVQEPVEIEVELAQEPEIDSEIEQAEAASLADLLSEPEDAEPEVSRDDVLAEDDMASEPDFGTTSVPEALSLTGGSRSEEPE